MLDVTPEKRAHLRAIGRLGGMAAAASTDVRARGRNGHAKFRQGFQVGHGCSVCPTISIPADLDEVERDRRADLLYRMHFVRLGRRRAA
jgi:hypothetical protein